MEYTCCVRRQCYCDNYFLDKLSRSSRPDVLCKKKVFLEISQNSQESTCARVSFLIKLKAQACNFIEKETLTQVFSCEFCGISKSTFSCRTSSVAASVINNFKTSFSICFEISYALKKRPHPAQVLPVNF